MVTGLIRPDNYNPGRSQKLIKLEISSCRCSQFECNEESDETTTILGCNDGVPRPFAQLHIKRSRHTQFFAPTKAFNEGVMTVSCQCPTSIRIE